MHPAEPESYSALRLLSDILWLQRDCGLYVVNLFDTGQAARVRTRQARARRLEPLDGERGEVGGAGGARLACRLIRRAVVGVARAGGARELRGDAPEQWSRYADPEPPHREWECLSGPNSRRLARWSGGEAMDVDESS